MMVVVVQGSYSQHVLVVPIHAWITATPTPYAPPAKILMKASFALKTVPQVTTKLERSITLVPRV